MKKINTFIVPTLTCLLLSTAALAASPADYDGHSYESVGYTSDDTDDEFNLAVIAKHDVIIGDTMKIVGSVYSNGNIYVTDGAGNNIEGLFISGTHGSMLEEPYTKDVRDCPGYIHITRDAHTTDGITYYSTAPAVAGSIYDPDTSFGYSYAPYDIPNVSKNGGSIVANQYWPGAVTVSEDTHYSSVEITGEGLIIDATNKDITVVIDNLNQNNAPAVFVRGNNKVKLYINNIQSYGQDTDKLSLKVINEAAKDVSNDWRLGSSEPNDYRPLMAQLGDPDKIDLYIGANKNSIDFQRCYIAANIYSNITGALTVSGSGKHMGNINSNATSFIITGGSTAVDGVVCVPNASSKVIDSGHLYGQIITEALYNYGTGNIIYKGDSAAMPKNTPFIDKPEPEEDITPLYEELGALVIHYDVLADTYSLGRMELVGHTPISAIGNALHYSVLDENTYYDTDEELPEDEYELAVERVTGIYELSESSLINNCSDRYKIFGRIDSNGYNTVLGVTPYAYKRIQREDGKNMYLCIADGNGNVIHAFMIIDESVQHADDYSGNISPFVYTFKPQGFKSFRKK